MWRKKKDTPVDPEAMFCIRDGRGRVVVGIGKGGGFVFTAPSGRKIPLDQVLEVLEKLIPESAE